LEVDEPGHRNPSRRPAGERDLDDDAVAHLDVAGNELPADEGRFDAEPHGCAPSAELTEPPALSSRSRAVAASTPASSDTSATRASPAEPASAASTSASDAPLAYMMLRRARARSLSFSGTTPIIRPPYVRPRRTIVTVEIVLS